MPATPGPWNFDRKSGFVEQKTEKPFEKVVCFIRGSAEDEEACANGKLIAASPSLLDALIKLSNEVFGSMPISEAVIRQEIGNTNYNCLISRAEEARAAIIKAKGEIPQ